MCQYLNTDGRWNRDGWQRGREKYLLVHSVDEDKVSNNNGETLEQDGGLRWSGSGWKVPASLGQSTEPPGRGETPARQRKGDNPGSIQMFPVKKWEDFQLLYKLLITFARADKSICLTPWASAFIGQASALIVHTTML